jgi:hypothetical protein
MAKPKKDGGWLGKKTQDPDHLDTQSLEKGGIAVIPLLVNQIAIDCVSTAKGVAKSFP